MVEENTYHLPVRIVVGVDRQVGETHISDEEYDSNHRTDCTDDVQAQAAIQLKKTQRVRVRQENYYI